MAGVSDESCTVQGLLYFVKQNEETLSYYFAKYKNMVCYHLIDMNTSILLVESQVILNCITGFKSKNILKYAIQGEKVQCTWCAWRASVSKSLVQIHPQTGNADPYYLFDYSNMENIN